MNREAAKYSVSCATGTLAALLAIGFALMPWLGDDLLYRMPYREYFVEDGAFDMSAVLGHIRYLYLENSPRLANILMIGLQFLPQWICGLLSGLACWISIYYSLRLVGAQSSVVIAMLFGALFVFLMPWVDQMYLFDFQLNYLWTGAVMVVYLYLLTGGGRFEKALAMSALILGFMNESCGFPAWLATVLLIVAFPTMRCTRNYVALALLTVGLAFLYLAPGMQSYRSSGWHPFATRSSIVLVSCLPALAYLSVLIFRSILRHSRGLDRVDAALALIALSGMLLMWFSQMGPRVGWASVLASICGLCRCLVPYAGRLGWVVAALYAFACVHLIVVDRMAWQEKRVYDDVVRQYRQAPSMPIYADFTLREHAPVLAMQKPYYDYFSHYRSMTLFSKFWNEGAPVAIVLPKALRDFKATEARTVNDGFMEYEGMLIGPCVSEKPSFVRVPVSREGRTYKKEDYFVTPFTDSDGVPRGWWHHNSSSFASMLRPIPDNIEMDDWLRDKIDSVKKVRHTQ